LVLAADEGKPMLLLYSKELVADKKLNASSS
jgi:hypothetical protein